MGDTWRPWIGPRVLILFATNRTRVNFLFTIQQPTKTCHVTTVRTVQTGTVSIKFFPVWLGEQIAISSPYGLCLRK